MGLEKGNKMRIAYAMGFAMLLAVPMNAIAQDVPEDSCRVIFDFEGPDALEDWETTNDNVMGGRSSGGPAIVNGALVFAGSTNTDGGGFSSIKASVPKRSLSDATSFQIRYKGDGRRYQFSVETGERRRLFFRIQYWVEFLAQESEGWEEVTIPLSEFKSISFGEPLDDRVLKPKRIKDIGFIIYDKEDGPFELTVDWIKACT
jgi:hypothetical protein